MGAAMVHTLYVDLDIITGLDVVLSNLAVLTESRDCPISNRWLLTKTLIHDHAQERKLVDIVIAH